MLLPRPLHSEFSVSGKGKRADACFQMCFNHIPIDNKMIDSLIRLGTSVIPCSNIDSATASSRSHSKQVPPLRNFIIQIVKSSHIGPAVLFVAMIYLYRLKSALPSTAKGLACTLHRIILASFILAEKILCDVPMKNRAWANHARIFTLEELNLMERQLMSLLHYRTHIDSTEVYSVLINHYPLEQVLASSMTPSPKTTPSRHPTSDTNRQARKATFPVSPVSPMAPTPNQQILFSPGGMPSQHNLPSGLHNGATPSAEFLPPGLTSRHGHQYIEQSSIPSRPATAMEMIIPQSTMMTSHPSSRSSFVSSRQSSYIESTPSSRSSFVWSRPQLNYVEQTSQQALQMIPPEYNRSVDLSRRYSGGPPPGLTSSRYSQPVPNEPITNQSSFYPHVQRDSACSLESQGWNDRYIQQTLSQNTFEQVDLFGSNPAVERPMNSFRNGQHHFGTLAQPPVLRQRYSTGSLIQPILEQTKPISSDPQSFQNMFQHQPSQQLDQQYPQQSYYPSSEPLEARWTYPSPEKNPAPRPTFLVSTEQMAQFLLRPVGNNPTDNGQAARQDRLVLTSRPHSYYGQL